MKLLSKERDIRPLREQYRIRDENGFQRHGDSDAAFPRLECGVDMWMVIGQEYNEDPVFKTITPSLVKTASRLSCFVFSIDKAGKYEAINLLPGRILGCLRTIPTPIRRRRTSTT